MKPSARAKAYALASCLTALFLLAFLPSCTAKPQASKTQQQGYGPREFNSDLKLRVWTVHNAGERHPLASTPSEHPLDIPESEFWGVKPLGDPDQFNWSKLAEQMRQKQVPGLAVPKGTSNNALSYFSKNHKLAYLDIANTNFQDKPLQKLKPATNLIVLNANHSQLTDKGIAPIAEFNNLRRVHLWDTNITDSALQDIGRLKQLRTLDLSKTDITNKALHNLQNLPSLKAIATESGWIRRRFSA